LRPFGKGRSKLLCGQRAVEISGNLHEILSIYLFEVFWKGFGETFLQKGFPEKLLLIINGGNYARIQNFAPAALRNYVDSRL
ncbi:MAG: hypothetical protein J6I42_14245, partial [Clostridia bacterium]|nr:hypothetical protein [Clostridia bacterium]